MVYSDVMELGKTGSEGQVSNSSITVTDRGKRD